MERARRGADGQYRPERCSAHRSGKVQIRVQNGIRALLQRRAITAQEERGIRILGPSYKRRQSLLRTGEVARGRTRRYRTVFPYGGTEGSNLSSSGGESAANLTFGGESYRRARANRAKSDLPRTRSNDAYGKRHAVRWQLAPRQGHRGGRSHFARLRGARALV
jgi:hypothetical protein